MASKPVVLSIAGYDPSSGAGITADVKTAAAMGCYAVTCITALTVQSTQGVFAVFPTPPEVVWETLCRLFEDVEIAAVRIGMLGTAEVTRVVANFFRRYTHPYVVFDPVLRASSGAALLDEPGVEVVRKFLLRRVVVVTPNFDEAQVLAGELPRPAPDSWEEALPRVRELAGKLHGFGCPAVVITGGQMAETNDYLRVWTEGKTEEQIFPGTHLDSRSTHGTGCAFATALACGLARGLQLSDAVRDAKEYVRRAIAASYLIGKGTGPINHLFGLEDGRL